MYENYVYVDGKQPCSKKLSLSYRSFSPSVIGQEGSHGRAPATWVVSVRDEILSVVHHQVGDKVRVHTKIIQPGSVVNVRGDGLAVAAASVVIVEEGPESPAVEIHIAATVYSKVERHSALSITPTAPREVRVRLQLDTPRIGVERRRSGTLPVRCF